MTRAEQERQYWDAAAQSDNLRNEWICDKNVSDEECLEAILPAIAKHQRLDSAMILEIGCGIGRLTTLIKKRYPKASVCGIDISEKMLEKAYAYSGFMNDRVHQSDYPFYYLTDGRHIPGPVKRCDAIYSMLVFQHIAANGVMKYINEAYRKLKRGGVFRFQYVEGTEQEPFSRHYQEHEILAWLEFAGFSVPEINRGVIFPQWTYITAVKL